MIARLYRRLFPRLTREQQTPEERRDAHWASILSKGEWQPTRLLSKWGHWE